MTAGDVTGDGVPDSILAGPSCAPDAKPGSCIGNGTLLVGTFQTATKTFSYVSSPLDGIVISEDGQLALDDVDGDGKLDVVLLSGSTADPGAGTDPSCMSPRSLWVLWNDGSGGFSMASATQVPAGTIGCDTPRAFTFLNLDAATPKVILYVTRTAVLYAQLGASRTLTSQPLGSGLAATSRKDCCAASYTGNELTGIAGGDIDGDGVDDFVVVNNADLYVYRGVARTPGTVQ
jgi:hypothetical protein